jgi:L-aminopeptidase/D-esterase-like protein
VHGIVLSGGSAWGLDAASGVMRWLEERGAGLSIGPARVPLVAGAVLFDLLLGDPAIRPDAQAGYRACELASNAAPSAGNVGAGAGAVVGKIFGIERAMKGGIGSASLTVNGITVGALVACNAMGDVFDPLTGQVIAGARTPDGKSLLDSRRALLSGEPPKAVLAGANTTIGVVATDAVITKAQASRLATMAHDGLARAINPVHTMTDGDTMFALGTGRAGRSPGMIVLGTLVAEVTALAVVRAVLAAQGVTLGNLHLPAARDLQQHT